MIVLIDNYDSFTFNLVHYLGGLGADVAVCRNDKISADDVIASTPEAIVLSPGPCTPNEAGICLELVSKASTTIPLLGVCLGHQAIGQAFGGKVIRAPVQVHGKLSEIRTSGAGVFRGINAPFQATRAPRCRANCLLPPRPAIASSWACRIRHCRSMAYNFIPRALRRKTVI
jgi:anthranilate synthase component 2